MAIAVTNIGTNNNAAGATVAVTVGAGGVPDGCIIVVQVAESSNSVPAGSVADSAGNTYSAVVGANHSGAAAQGFGRIFHIVGAIALVNTNTITYTKAVSGSSASISACYVTGADTNSPLDTAVTASATGNSTTPSVTSGTPAMPGELFIGFSSENNVRVYTQAAGWTSPPTLVNAAIPFTIGGNQTNSGVGTLTYNPTLAIGAQWMAAVIAYKPLIVGFSWLAEPVRVDANLKRAVALIASGAFAPVLDNETQIINGYESRWHYAWSEPVRFKQGLAARYQPPYTRIDVLAPPIKFLPLSEPIVKVKPWLKTAHYQFYTRIDELPPPIKFLALSEPLVKTKPWLKTSQHQYLIAPTRLLPNPNITGTLAATDTQDLMRFFGTVTIIPSVAGSIAGLIERFFQPTISIVELAADPAPSAPVATITSASVSIHEV